MKNSLEKRLEVLYVRAINESLDNLRFFYYEGRQIPYVLVNDKDILNLGGTAYGNLYFVAKDRFPEEWQQRVTAYHESFCHRRGHGYAKIKERELARFLGKEKEWLKIRKKLDDETKSLKRKFERKFRKIMNL